MADPPEELIVDHLDMSLWGNRFRANGETLEVKTPDGGIRPFEDCSADFCEVGFSF